MKAFTYNSYDLNVCVYFFEWCNWGTIFRRMSQVRWLFFFFTALCDWLRKLPSILSANQMQNLLKLYFEFLAHFLLVMLTFGVISSQWWFCLFWLSDPWSQSFSLKKNALWSEKVESGFLHSVSQVFFFQTLNNSCQILP